MSIQIQKFNEINLEDKFFDSLKADYPGFDKWFYSKADEEAFILQNGQEIQAFLYMKEESVAEISQKIQPKIELNSEKILKVGTFKIDAHGTKLGERFIKLIFDKMIEKKLRKGYVTIFEKHSSLISLLIKYGFQYHGKKEEESVYIKDFDKITGDIQKDYPMIKLKGNKKLILSIHPPYHTKLFPDSKLHTERSHIIQDLSCTNSIEKIYLSASRDLLEYQAGDIIAIYRTAEPGQSAEYNSVLTTVCTLKEVRDINTFASEQEFLQFCKDRTIFSEIELKYFWKEKRYPYIATMLYNISLNKRIIRKRMIEEIGVSRLARIVAYQIPDIQMDKILELGRSDKEFITY